MLKIKIKEKEGKKYALLVYCVGDYVVSLTYERDKIMAVADLTQREYYALLRDNASGTYIDI